MRIAQSDTSFEAADGSVLIIAAGSAVAISPYHTHHDARWLRDGADFKPSRFFGTATAPSSAAAPSTTPTIATTTIATLPRRRRTPPEGVSAHPPSLLFGPLSTERPESVLGLQLTALALGLIFRKYTVALVPGRQSEIPADRAPPPGWLEEARVPGRHIVARGVTSGDADGVLPQFDAAQLFGVKRPTGALLASVRPRTERR